MKEIHYKHKVVMFVPCFLNIENPSYPTFTFSMSEATQDEQLAYSLGPDYVFKLEGDFDAVAKSKE